jgi:hypothetical protein
MRVPRRKLRRYAPLLATAAVVVAGAVGAAAVFLTGSGNRSADRRSVCAYEAAVYPIVQRGGQLVELGIKPFVKDFQLGKLDGKAIVDRAPGWRNVLADVRVALARVREPPSLRGIARLLDESMAGYLASVGGWRRAGSIEAAGDRGPRLREATQDAITTATRADRTYDRASALLQSVRRRLGLGPSTHFPDPDHSQYPTGASPAPCPTATPSP